ncbi:MAG: cysteine desulfurase family protein [Rhodospirillaceae bacterium]|nr:cysteine desulfurase family protein [Rhodospirillaceae bacterium]
MTDTSTIYADYQATTPLDPRVRERMAPFWRESFGNPHSSDHAVGWQAHRAVEDGAASVAALIGADADEIVFTSGATEANNLALFGLTGHAPSGPHRILVSAIEHKCILAACRAIAARKGFKIEMIPVDHEGMLDLSALEAALEDDVLMASVMAVNNEVGTIQDLPAISELLSSRNIPFHCDAAQAPSAMDMKYLAHHADMISLSAHKMYGPQGIGALYIRRNLQNRIEPLIYGGGQQNGLRSGTLPLPLCVGMGAAAELAANSDAAVERARVALQRDQFVCLLRDGGADIVLNGSQTDRRHPGNANLQFTGCEAEWILTSLQPALAASSGAACTSGTPEPSHVLRAMSLSAEESDASIRFSFGRFTTDEEVNIAARLVLQALQTDQ